MKIYFGTANFRILAYRMFSFGTQLISFEINCSVTHSHLLNSFRNNSFQNSIDLRNIQFRNSIKIFWNKLFCNTFSLQIHILELKGQCWNFWNFRGAVRRFESAGRRSPYLLVCMFGLNLVAFWVSLLAPIWFLFAPS